MACGTLNVSLSGEVDPCSEAECDVNADCIAHETTYQCVCKPGYEGTGRRCQGIWSGPVASRRPVSYTHLTLPTTPYV